MTGVDEEAEVRALVADKYRQALGWTIQDCLWAQSIERVSDYAPCLIYNMAQWGGCNDISVAEMRAQYEGR